MMTFEIYRAWTIYGRRWFWRLKAANHRIIAVGGEGFANRNDVIGIINTMMTELSAARVREL